MLLVSDLLYELGPTKNNPDELVKHPMEKMQILVNYIAENMENNEQDEQVLNELVYAAKKNIAETIINLKDEENLSLEDQQLHFDMGENENVRMANAMTTMFLKAPETMARNIAEGNLQEGANVPDDNETEEEKAAKKEKLKNAFRLLQGKEASYAAYEAQHADVKNDMLFLENMFPNESDYPLKDARNEIKPGFFEKVFGRTSREFKEFERTFNAREKGNATRDELDNAAKAYLMHKIPGYDGDGIPTVQQINALTGKSKDRAMFCIKTLMANEESREYEEKLNSIMGAVDRNLNERGLGNDLRQLQESNSHPIQDVDAYLADQANQQQQANQEQQANQVQEEEPSFELQEYIAQDLAAEDEQGMDNYEYEDDSIENDNEVEKDDEELGLD